MDTETYLKLNDELAKQLIDQGNFLRASAVEAYAVLGLKEDALNNGLAILVADAFMLGAQHYHHSFIRLLSQDGEITDTDRDRMAKIAAELDEFFNEISQRRAQAGN